MFAALPSMQPHLTPPHYIPAAPVHQPSPLSPHRRSSISEMPNTTTTPTPTPNPFSSPHQPDPTTSPLSARSSRTPSSTYAQRYLTSSNPFTCLSRSATTTTSPSARNARRNAFFNRVKQDRDNGRFSSRGEQLVLMEHVAEQKRWEEMMRRRADEIEVMDMHSEGDGDDGEEAGADDAELRALDEYILQEEMEMEMLRQANADPNSNSNTNMTMQSSANVHAGFGTDAQQQNSGSRYDSFSDDEYEHIFMNLADNAHPGSQDMDMSG